MDVRIGLIDNPREINVDLGDKADRAAVKGAIEAALAGESSTLWLIDAKGNEVGIAAAKLAFAELSAEGSSKTIGFG